MSPPPALAAMLTGRTRVVPVPASGGLTDLLSGCRVPLVFSARECRLSGARADLTGWAGRLAAKLAAADLLGLDAESALREGRDVGLAQVEVLPDRAACLHGTGCRGSHRPTLQLGPVFGETICQWTVSVSHTRSRAVALVARLSEGSVRRP